MPSFAELLARFSSLAGAQASIGVTVTAALLFVGRDWRLSIAALASQYLLAVILFSQNLPPPVAGVKLLVGLLASIILALSGRQAQAIRSSRAQAGAAVGSGNLLSIQGSILPTGLPFRVVAALIVALAAWTSAGRPGALPEVSADVALAVFALCAMSLLVIAFSEAPLQIGLGLLTFLTGFELFYQAVEPSLSVIAMLAMAHFGIAVAAGYLTIVEAGR